MDPGHNIFLCFCLHVDHKCGSSCTFLSLEMMVYVGIPLWDIRVIPVDSRFSLCALYLYSDSYRKKNSEVHLQVRNLNEVVCFVLVKLGTEYIAVKTYHLWKAAGKIHLKHSALSLVSPI